VWSRARLSLCCGVEGAIEDGSTDEREGTRKEKEEKKSNPAAKLKVGFIIP